MNSKAVFFVNFNDKFVISFSRGYGSKTTLLFPSMDYFASASFPYLHNPSWSPLRCSGISIFYAWREMIGPAAPSGCLLRNHVPSILTSESIIFGNNLQPWLHFAPVAIDGSDLLEKFNICKANETLCETAAYNGHQYMQPYMDTDL